MLSAMLPAMLPDMLPAMLSAMLPAMLSAMLPAMLSAILPAMLSAMLPAMLPDMLPAMLLAMLLASSLNASKICIGIISIDKWNMIFSYHPYIHQMPTITVLEIAYPSKSIFHDFFQNIWIYSLDFLDYVFF